MSLKALNITHVAVTPRCPFAFYSKGLHSQHVHEYGHEKIYIWDCQQKLLISKTALRYNKHTFELYF